MEEDYHKSSVHFVFVFSLTVIKRSHPNGSMFGGVILMNEIIQHIDVSTRRISQKYLKKIVFIVLIQHSKKLVFSSFSVEYSSMLCFWRNSSASLLQSSAPLSVHSFGTTHDGVMNACNASLTVTHFLLWGTNVSPKSTVLTNITLSTSRDITTENFLSRPIPLSRYWPGLLPA